MEKIIEITNKKTNEVKEFISLKEGSVYMGFSRGYLNQMIRLNTFENRFYKWKRIGNCKIAEAKKSDEIDTSGLAIERGMLCKLIEKLQNNYELSRTLTYMVCEYYPPFYSKVGGKFSVGQYQPVAEILGIPPSTLRKQSREYKEKAEYLNNKYKRFTEKRNFCTRYKEDFLKELGLKYCKRS